MNKEVLTIDAILFRGGIIQKEKEQVFKSIKQLILDFDEYCANNTQKIISQSKLELIESFLDEGI